MCMEDVKIAQATTVSTRSLVVAGGANVDICPKDPGRLALRIALEAGQGSVIPAPKANGITNGFILTNALPPYDVNASVNFGLPMQPHSFVDSGVGCTLIIVEVLLKRDVK